jgi:hypothetical protein
MEKKFFFIELKHKLFFSKRWQKRDKNSLILSGNSIGKMKVVYAIKNILLSKGKILFWSDIAKDIFSNFDCTCGIFMNN